MDPFGCPSGYATDNILLRHPGAPCAVPIAAFIVPLLILIVVKLYVLKHVWTFWLSRRAETLKSKAFLNRHPVVPVLLSGVCFLFVLILILVPTNVISAFNGWGMVLVSCTSGVWATYCLFHVKKYIRLGRRLIPLAIAHVPSSPTPASSGSKESGAAENSLRLLNTFDRSLQFLVGLMVVSICASLVLALIPGLVLPNQEIWTRISFILIGFFAFFLYISLLYHLERLIRATNMIFYESRRNNQNGASTVKLEHAIKIMRTSQTVWFVLGNITFLMYFLGGLGIIDMGWILLICSMVIETAASAFAYFATTSRAKTRRTKQESSSSKTREQMPHNNHGAATTTGTNNQTGLTAAGAKSVATTEAIVPYTSETGV